MAVIVPAPHVPVRPFGVETTSPAGSVSLKPTPVSAANHQRYGVSSTPTLAILDRSGIIRTYNPGRLTEAELEARIAPLLEPTH